MADTTFPSYNPVSKAIHWIVAALVLVMFATALCMEVEDAFWRKWIFIIHKTTGFFVLCLMVLRVIWGHFRPAPPLPLERFPRWQALAARFVHDSLYALTLIIPIIGWALVSMGPYGLSLFGVVDIPALPGLAAMAKDMPDAKLFISTLHETLATILVCLLMVHIGATFLHHFVDRDEILMRIAPRCLHPWLDRIRGL